MFGADTPLVMEVLQVVGLAAVATGGTVWLFMRRRQAAPTAPAAEDDLEERVRVLERIATDRSHKLADEIERLREDDEDRPVTPMSEGPRS